MQLDPSILSDGVDGDTLDGVYTDVQARWVKDFRCFDGNGTLVTSPTGAASATLTNWPGHQYKFDVFDLTVPGPTDALAWWKFDDGAGQSAADATGNGNAGALVNNPAWTSGQSAGALSFDGISNYVDAGNPADLNFQDEEKVPGTVVSAQKGKGEATHFGPQPTFSCWPPTAFQWISSGSLRGMSCRPA